MQLPADRLLPYPVPSWATRLELPDDGAVQVALPGAMRFYQQSFTSIFVGSNGYVTFGEPSSNRSGAP